MEPLIENTTEVLLHFCFLIWLPSLYTLHKHLTTQMVYTVYCYLMQCTSTAADWLTLTLFWAQCDFLSVKPAHQGMGFPPIRLHLMLWHSMIKLQWLTLPDHLIVSISVICCWPAARSPEQGVGSTCGWCWVCWWPLRPREACFSAPEHSSPALFPCPRAPCQSASWSPWTFGHRWQTERRKLEVTAHRIHIN